MLKVSPWKGMIRFGKKGKLNPRYIGRFEILDRIGRVAYRLQLPQELSNVHDIFHVLNLKKCLSNDTLVVPLDEIQLNTNSTFFKEQVEIMDREVIRFKQSHILSSRCVGTLNVDQTLPMSAKTKWDRSTPSCLVIFQLQIEFRVEILLTWEECNNYRISVKGDRSIPVNVVRTRSNE